MYCVKCGSKVEESFKYCSSCGTKIENLGKKSIEVSNSTGNAATQHGHGRAKGQTLPTFEQFLKAKSEERQSNFRPKKRSKPSINEVTLNIGLMEYVLGELKPCRGNEMTESAVDSDHCSDEGSYLGTDDDVGDNTFGEKVEENEVSSSDVIMSTITPYVTTDFM